ncbi:MAG: HEPN domain-containing protein [Chloroflexi bacterium]|nr:HEPN domain-containing protein [Chloroflexota bacterium]
MKTVTRPRVRQTPRSGAQGKVKARRLFPQARHLTPSERRALNAFKDFWLKKLPGQIERIVLYGSKARGDSTPDSDLDVLVVVNGNPASGRRLDAPGFDLLMKYGAFIQSVWMSVEETQHWTPLLDSIWKEGIELWRRRGAPVWVHPESEGRDVTADKAEAIETRMILAQDKLAAARQLLQGGFLNDTISKSYYAMFYASKAMLLAIGVDPHKHRGVASLVGEKIVHHGLSDPKYGTLINQYMQLRLDADYEPEFHATLEQAEESIRVAEDFIQEAARVLERIRKQSQTAAE